MDNYIPKGFQWIKGKGLMKSRKKDLLEVSNAIPRVLEKQNITYFGKSTGNLYIKLQYIDYNDNILGEGEIFSEDDIKSGKFLKKAPMSVIIDIKFMSSIKNIYKYIIQKQLAEMRATEKTIYTFGWNQQKYYWGDECNIEMQTYDSAVKLAEILNEENHIITALVLAAIHGPIKTVLSEANISHDFVTFIVGKSGIGKTQLTKIFCNYIPEEKFLFQLGSNRKAIKKVIEDSKDITIVMDDFNQTSSNRVRESLLQILSEVIQSASDSGKNLVDEFSKEKKKYNTHIVSTGESIINNISTLNRCYLVFMEEKIEDSLWNKISTFNNNNGMWIFMRSFIKFIEINYKEILERCRTNYSHYQDQLFKTTKITSSSSRNRIINTLAVQLTIKQLIIDYLNCFKIDGKLVNNVDKNITSTIYSCGQDLESEITSIEKEKKHMCFLPTLLEIIIEDTQNRYDSMGYIIEKDEETYMKKIKCVRGNRYIYNHKHQKRPIPIGICVNRGYISFNPKYMCQLIAEKLRIESVSVRELGKELSYYGLAHFDTERKISCKWKTTNRMYHVRFLDLKDCVFTHYVNEKKNEDIREWYNFCYNNYAVQRFEETYC